MTVDYGPPPQAPTITCSQISVDPPSVSWIKVTFHVTINHVEHDVTVSYGAPTPHLAVADISGLTAAEGSLDISAFSTWTLGSGNSASSAVTLTCHPLPTTTTSSTSSTTSTTFIHIDPPAARVVTTSSTTVPKSLPYTGTMTAPLGGIGLALVAIGAILVSKFRG